MNIKSIGIASLLGLVSGIAAQASTSYTFTDTGRASAVVTVDLNKITIVLNDLVINPNDVTDNLSAVWFTTSVTPTSPSLASSSGQNVTVAGNDTYSLGSTVATGWGLTLVGAVTKLDDIGFGGPDNTIIGSPSSTTNTYSNGNGSINGNSPHNPFLYKTATFTLNETGITASTVISNLRFQFGTADNAGEASTLTSTVVSSTPEPGTYTMLLGGVALIFLGRKKYAQRGR